MPPHLHKRKGRKYWEIVEGRKRTSTGTTRRILAEKMLDSYYLRGRGITVNSNEPTESYINPYLSQSRRFNKISTIDDKRRTLEYFSKHCEQVPIGSLKRETMLAY